MKVSIQLGRRGRSLASVSPLPPVVSSEQAYFLLRKCSSLVLGSIMAAAEVIALPTPSRHLL